MLAIRSRRYTTAGPVQSAVSKFGPSRRWKSPAFLYRLCARWSRFTLHGGTQTMRGYRRVFARKPHVHARQRSMDSPCKFDPATSSRNLSATSSVRFVSPVCVRRDICIYAYCCHRISNVNDEKELVFRIFHLWRVILDNILM